MAILCILSH
ncbi:hypothetical protein F383_25281 [Gossypium arboreum]|uniref:Uncharacterized protein n=1 Tax=Gossypium arboreum TaxID=29729 RepID=A0A0B0P0S8_GOSAR|nr:hypothetical protein F383_25281 [Gossypium arboreum]